MFRFSISFGGGYSYVCHRDGSVTVGAIQPDQGQKHFNDYPEHLMCITAMTGSLDVGASTFHPPPNPGFSGTSTLVVPGRRDGAVPPAATRVAVNFPTIPNLSTWHSNQGYAVALNWRDLLKTRMRLFGGTLSEITHPDGDTAVMFKQNDRQVGGDWVHCFTNYDVDIDADWLDFVVEGDEGLRYRVHPSTADPANPVIWLKIGAEGDPELAAAGEMADFRAQYVLMPTVPDAEQFRVFWLGPQAVPTYDRRVPRLYPPAPPRPGVHCVPGLFTAD